MCHSHSVLKPSCLQATIASLVSQKSLHTVPHCPWRHTSTRPSSFELFLPPTSRISVLLQAATADIWRDNIFILATGHSYGTYQWLQSNYNILVSMHTQTQYTTVLCGQNTPASSWWPQSWIPTLLWVHSSRFVSCPLQLTSSKKMGPVPGSKVPLLFKATSEIAIASARCASYKMNNTISRQNFLNFQWKEVWQCVYCDFFGGFSVYNYIYWHHKYI